MGGGEGKERKEVRGRKGEWRDICFIIGVRCGWIESIWREI